MKKHLFIFLSCCLISACNMVDQQRLKAEIKEEIIKELENERNVVKGNGYYFYNEQVAIGEDGYYIHHSTLDCPAIKSGVKRDFTYSSLEDRNLFCPKCMNDALIEHFNKRYFSNKKK